jgi:hypothetical protein
MAKDLNRDFSQEGIQRTNKHMERCSNPAAMRECKSEPGRSHFTPTRIARLESKR